MKEQFKIEKGIKVPQKKSSKYPFADMVVGDSFFVPSANVNSARVNGYKYAKENRIKILVRDCEGGARIWRIK